MDFLNEEDVALLELGENVSEVGGFLHGQPADENVIKWFAATLGRGDAHIKALLHLGLPPEISEDRGPERLLKDSGRLG